MITLCVLLTQGERNVVQVLYPTPFHAMFNVTLEIAGGPDSEFFDLMLTHRIMTYVLYITFIVAVAILFNNFLVSIVSYKGFTARYFSRIQYSHSPRRSIESNLLTMNSGYAKLYCFSSWACCLSDFMCQCSIMTSHLQCATYEEDGNY